MSNINKAVKFLRQEVDKLRKTVTEETIRESIARGEQGECFEKNRRT